MNDISAEPAPAAGIGTGSIHARVARVQAAVRNMPKDKTATIQMKNGGTYSFDYITKGALEAEARQMLCAEGVAIYVSEESIEQTGNRCRVTVAITLACDLSRFTASKPPASEITIKRSGYGNADDDKGPAKAGTTAVRLALADLLLQGGDDVAEHDYVEYRPSIPGQALVEGDRPATPQQLKYAADLVMRSQLDRAMPSASHAILRLSRAVTQQEIAPGLEVNDALRLIPSAAISKVIERIESVQPAGAKAVWDKVAAWEVEQGLSPDMDPTAEAKAQYDARDDDVPF